MKFVYFLVWCWEWFEDLLLICWCCISCCKLCFVIKWLSPPFHLSMSFALYLRHGCGKRMYHFEGRIARRESYYYRGSCRAPRQMHGQICPPWISDWETAGVYRDERHASRYLTLHLMALHILLLMNLNMCFADLVIVSLWILWLLNIELLLRMCKLIECGYWVVYLVNC